MGCPWDLPAHRGCPAGPVPNTGDQQRGPVGCPRPASAPSPTVSASPAACKRRAGLDGAAGERHQARATSHQDRLGGTQARPSAPALNQGAAICSPRSPTAPIFVCSWGLTRAPRDGGGAGLGTRIQPSSRQGSVPGDTGGGDVALSPPSNQQWAPIFRTGPASPCQAPLQARCGRGCSEARAGTRTGTGGQLGTGPHVTLQ